MNWLQRVDRAKEWIAIYLGAVSCILVPLYIEGSYFGLIELKARTYLRGAIPGIAVMAVLVGIGLFGDRNKSGKSEQKALPKEQKISLILLSLIGAWSLFSSLMSHSPRLSLLGSRGWCVGSLMTMVLVIETIIVSRYFQFNPYVLLPVMAANLFINILTVIQSASINIFGLQNGLIEGQYYLYLSTIGNANSYSGYLCLVLPLFWGAFMSCKEWATEVLYGIFAAFGFMGIILAESDSIYVGIAVCLIFVLLFVFGSEQYLKRSAILLIIYGCCILFVRYFPMFEAKTKRFTGASKIMLGSPVAEVILVCGIVLYLTAGKIFQSGKGRYLLIALEALIIAVICIFAVNSVINFNDNWGNTRGGIWRTGWEYFAGLPLGKKITGLGPEMLFEAYSKMYAETGRNVVTAHCDILQVLLAQGIVGLGLYFAFWGHLLTLFFRKKIWKSNTAVFFFPLAAYWGQSIFCTVYPVTAVVFSFMAGMYLKNAE